MGQKARESRARIAGEIARLVALTVEPESATERAGRIQREHRQARRTVSGYLGQSSTVRKYSHGTDCRRWMTGAEYERDYQGSRAVVVRLENAEDSPRLLVHLCGIKDYESCAIQAQYNRIPDSRVASSDTTAAVGRKGSEGALRDCQTRYQLGKAVYV